MGEETLLYQYCFLAIWNHNKLQTPSSHILKGHGPRLAISDPNLSKKTHPNLNPLRNLNPCQRRSSDRGHLPGSLLFPNPRPIILQCSGYNSCNGYHGYPYAPGS